MNTQMVGGVARWALAIGAGASMADGSQSLDQIVPNLLHGIASGDMNAIVSTSIALFVVLWSMWTKATEQTKQAVVSTLTFNKL